MDCIDCALSIYSAPSASASNDEVYTYNLQAQPATLADQDDDVHTYTYDVLGRTTLDAVTTLGSGVDGTIRALGNSFDTGGRLYQATSYSNAAGTTVANQLQYAYDGWGQEVTQYQNDSGAVNTSTTPKVQYVYTENAGSQNNDRQMAMVYPNGRVEDTLYGNAEYPISSITHSGTTATATMLSNVYTVGGSVTISGADQSAYDGTFTVTAVNTSTHTFSYTMSSTPASNATGVDLIVTTPGATLDGSISRVTALMDHSGTSAGVHVEEYTYLGLSTIVTENRPEAHEELTYIKVSGDTSYHDDGGDGRYTGLDRFGRVSDQYWLKTSSSPNAIDRFQYGYDRDGNVLYKDNLLSASFSELYHISSTVSGDDNTAYDPLNREIGFRRGTLAASANNGGVLDVITAFNSLAGHMQNFTLDAVGNQTSVTTDSTAVARTQNTQNEIGTVGSASLTYDSNGNLTKNELGYTLTYDAWNRLMTSTHSSLVQTYDALGNAIHFTTSTGNDNNQYYDKTGQMIESSNGTVHEQYVWGMAYVNELVLRDRNADNASGGNYGLSGSGMEERLYANQDANWNTTSLYQVNGTAGVAERIIYSPYGATTVLTSAWATFSSSTIYFRMLYQGTFQLDEAGVDVMGARMYSYTLGTWDQKDPAGYVDGLNLYQFADDKPEGAVDPSGTTAVVIGFGLTELMGGAAAALTGYVTIGYSDDEGLSVGLTGTATAGPAGGIGPGVTAFAGGTTATPTTGASTSAITQAQGVVPGAAGTYTYNHTTGAQTFTAGLNSPTQVGGSIRSGYAVNATITSRYLTDHTVEQMVDNERNKRKGPTDPEDPCPQEIIPTSGDLYGTSAGLTSDAFMG